MCQRVKLRAAVGIGRAGPSEGCSAADSPVFTGKR